MTLNGVIVFIFCYFTEFDSFGVRLASLTVAEDIDLYIGYNVYRISYSTFVPN